MTTEQAAEILGVSTRRVRIFIAQGRLTAVKRRPPPHSGRGGRWHYDITEESVKSFTRIRGGRRKGQKKGSERVVHFPIKRQHSDDDILDWDGGESEHAGDAVDYLRLRESDPPGDVEPIRHVR